LEPIEACGASTSDQILRMLSSESAESETMFIQRPNVEAEGPQPAGRAELKIGWQRSAASWRRSARAQG
jgi:hypothetical protein